MTQEGTEGKEEPGCEDRYIFCSVQAERDLIGILLFFLLLGLRTTGQRGRVDRLD